jgi:hypothetical protein
MLAIKIDLRFTFGRLASQPCGFEGEGVHWIIPLRFSPAQQRWMKETPSMGPKIGLFIAIWIGAFLLSVILMSPFFIASFSFFGSYQFGGLADAFNLLWRTESPRAWAEGGLLAALLLMASLSAIVAGTVVAIRFRKALK